MQVEPDLQNSGPHSGGRRFMVRMGSAIPRAGVHRTVGQVNPFLRPLRLAATWGSGDPHSASPPFADTEEVTGSNPVAPLPIGAAQAGSSHPARFIMGQPVADSGYRFRHAVIQETIYRSLLRRKRQDLHGRVARALEARYPDRREDLAATLALHFREAGQPQQAAGYFSLAGDQASRPMPTARQSSRTRRLSRCSMRSGAPGGRCPRPN